MSRPGYETFDVPVDGGSLRVAKWGRGEPVVLAAHGITASHLSWAVVAEHLGDRATLVAPDLRGRGASNGLPGPYGMAAHARDLVAVADHVGVERPLVAGHSMGGFVAGVMALNHSERVEGVVFIDGGAALRVPEGVDTDTILHAVIGPAMARLEMSFVSVDAYRDFWRAHPALTGDWSRAVQEYVDYDLEGEEPQLRSRVSAAAVRADAEDTLVREESRSAIEKIDRAARFLRAPRGMFNEVPPLYPDDAVADLQARMSHIGFDVVPDVNHYTILLAPHGAAAVAEALLHIP